jgi:hypothetical protein
MHCADTLDCPDEHRTAFPKTGLVAAATGKHRPMEFTKHTRESELQDK